MATILLRLAALVVAVACTTGCGLVSETPPWMQQDADASVQGSDAASTDNGGGSDAAPGTDVAQQGTDVSKETFACPTAQRPQALEELYVDDVGICLTSFEAEAFNLLAASRGVIVDEGCWESGNSDFCAIDYFLVGPPQKGGVFSVKVKYQGEENLSSFDFQECDSVARTCTYVGDIKFTLVMPADKPATFKRLDGNLLFEYTLVSKTE